MDYSLTSTEARLFRVVLMLSGRNPANFAAGSYSAELVRVQGPAGIAFYPRAEWMVEFAKHLCRGYFERAKFAPED